MTDDISKVVREMRNWIANRNDAQPVTLKRWADRLESATTPAEVGVLARGWFHRRGPGDDYDIHDEASGAGEDCLNCVPCVMVSTDDYATLARQLAKSERDCAELRALLTAQNAAIARTDDLARQLASVTESRDMAKGIIDALAAEMKAAGVELIDYKVVNTRADDLARQLAEANSELAMHRVDATRVAACPWRVQKGHTSECQPPKRLQDALDQLAEATRRLGEVEEVLRQIDTYHGPIRTPIHTITKLRGMARAALNKEPTK